MGEDYWAKLLAGLGVMCLTMGVIFLVAAVHVAAERDSENREKSCEGYGSLSMCVKDCRCVWCTGPWPKRSFCSGACNGTSVPGDHCGAGVPRVVALFCLAGVFLFTGLLFLGLGARRHSKT